MGAAAAANAARAQTAAARGGLGIVALRHAGQGGEPLVHRAPSPARSRGACASGFRFPGARRLRAEGRTAPEGSEMSPAPWPVWLEPVRRGSDSARREFTPGQTAGGRQFGGRLAQKPGALRPPVLCAAPLREWDPPNASAPSASAAGLRFLGAGRASLRSLPGDFWKCVSMSSLWKKGERRETGTAKNRVFRRDPGFGSGGAGANTAVSGADSEVQTGLGR